MYKQKRVLQVLVTPILVIGIFVSTLFFLNGKGDAAELDFSLGASENSLTETSTIFLPLVIRNFPLPPTVFGAETFRFTDPAVIQLAVDANVSWLRIPAFDWSAIEPNPPVNGVHSYDWSQVPESSLKNIADNYMYAIAMVQMTPAWAQKYPGIYCGPVAQNHFANFAAFLQAAVQRYSKAPYNVHYWELGNEPDIDRSLVPPDNGYGCWGDKNNSYYGGGYYAEMLKVAYPAIKAADPQAQVLIGGLLLNCDPVDPDCTDPLPPKFFEGILRNGGGDYFDIVSYHGYAYFNNDLIREEFLSGWDQRGGSVLGKADFLRDLMASYGVSKPLLLTEGALLCPSWNTQDCDPPGTTYEDLKADYTIWLFVRSLANDFKGSIWFTLEGSGWSGSSLIGNTSAPNPAYDAFNFMTEELAEAQYLGQPLGAGGELRAYSFRVPGKTIWVVWSVDGLAHNLTLPTGYSRVVDKFGDPVTVTGGVLGVNSPVYIEIP